MSVHQLTPYVLVELVRGDQILLLKREKTGFADGCYSLPGGHVEKGETFHKAAIRELFEELGIVLEPESLALKHTFQRRGTETELIALIFMAHAWSGEPYNKEAHKHSDLKWFSPNNLPSNLVPAHEQALACIRAGIPYSEHNYESS